MSESLEQDFTPEDLGSIFGSEAEVEAEVSEESIETPTESEVEAEVSETETGVVSDSPPESVDTKSDITVPLAALHAERDKRQALQARLDAVEVKPEAVKQVSSEIPSIYDGEAEFNQGVQVAIDKGISKAIFNSKLTSSQKSVVSTHGEEVVQKALDKATEAMKTNTKLVERFRGAESPFEEIMVIAKELGDAERFNNPDLIEKWKQDERKIIEAEVAARHEGDVNREAELDNSIPESMTNARSKGTLKGVARAGATPIGSIFPD